MKKFILRVLLFLFCLVLITVGAVVLFIGPWPLYRETNFEDTRYFKRSLAAMDTAAASMQLGGEVAPLKAGWAERDITPEAGFPMAGYGGRANEKRSEGIKERVYIRALALNDGTDTVVLLGSDLLQTLPNLLELVEPRIQERVGLSNSNIMYTSSHTHCGPGGFAPGMIAKEAFGEFAPDYLRMLADQFTDVIAEAVETMAPARIARAGVDVPEYIRNRTRIGGPVDSMMHILVVEKLDSGERIHVARYSAHGTVYGEEMMLINGDYAGAFQRALKEKTGHPLLFMGGAVGAMRPYPPGPPMPEPTTQEERLAFENDIESSLVRKGKKTLATMLRDQEARVEAMGAALAEKLSGAVAGLEFEDRLDVAAFASFYTPPPAQARLLSSDWRMSPYLFGLLGVPTTGRLQAARIGDVVLVGLPYDVGGEPSLEWQATARQGGATLWVTSFSGAYLGYLSPDENYYDIGEGRHYNENYEIGQMGWFGPDQERYVTALVEHALQLLSVTSD